ncbi:hypothetical protein Vafri_7021 [Volvox africanus]|uniref:Uncharacterized protein n=1 Tax=Volvox africanus TaxID=51714 RepID=A0A8J4EWK7_9CHLO|nr:hypothetical protein Vafri_7021 [Volvox africanus]
MCTWKLSARLSGVKVCGLILVILALHGTADVMESPNNRNAYVDFVLNPNSSASVLQGFKKRSTTAVVYICFNRTALIEPALESVLRSEDLHKFDFIISQDGGSAAPLNPKVPNNTNYVYIHHKENLNTGIQDFFVKQLAFEVLGYESLIVIEEDVVIHPQAIQMLKFMLDMSIDDLEIGLVSIIDVDNSFFIDMGRYNSSVHRVAITEGHLWMYGIHATRYRAVREHLLEYTGIIRHEDFESLHKDTVAARIRAMHKRKGIPLNIALSQDGNLIFSLRLEGFDRRLNTVARFYRPLGYWGVHFRDDKESFFGRFGTEMFGGRVQLPPKETTCEDMVDMAETCRARLDELFMRHLGRHPDEKARNFAVSRLLGGNMNGVVLTSCVTRTAKRRTPECREMYWV